MYFDSEEFLLESQNPLYDWPYVNTTLGIVAHGNATSRKNGLKLIDNKGFIWLEQKGEMVRSVCESSSRDFSHLVVIDYEDCEFSCECEAFEFNDGPCKHIVAVALRSLVKFEGSDSQTWVKTAVEESRNAQSGRKAWEKEPSFNEGVARKFGAKVVDYQKARKTIQCYELDNGKYWTGPLPVPEPDDKITVVLPTGEKLPARVMEHVDNDSSDFKALKVKLGKTPKHFDKKVIRVYGNEVFRNESQIIKEEQGSETRRSDRQSGKRSDAKRRRRSGETKSNRNRRGSRRGSSRRSRRGRK